MLPSSPNKVYFVDQASNCERSDTNPLSPHFDQSDKSAAPWHICGSGCNDFSRCSDDRGLGRSGAARMATRTGAFGLRSHARNDSTAGRCLLSGQSPLARSASRIASSRFVLGRTGRTVPNKRRPIPAVRDGCRLSGARNVAYEIARRDWQTQVNCCAKRDQHVNQTAGANAPVLPFDACRTGFPLCLGHVSRRRMIGSIR